MKNLLETFANFMKKSSSKEEDREVIIQKIAALLKTSPEALQKFEEAYAKQALDEQNVSDNLFEVSAKQAKMRAETPEDLGQYLNGIIDRIVDELLAQTVYYAYDGKQAHSSQYTLPEAPKKPVTKEELEVIPLEMRPQLTGTMMKVDFMAESYIELLNHYRKYLQDPDSETGKMFYNLFRQGLDILDLDPITYEVIGTNPNSIGKWFPQLVNGISQQNFFKTPATTIIKVPMTLLQLTRVDYQELTPTTIAILDRYCQKVFHLDESKEYFIKTGTYSSKFDYRNAYVHGAKEVRELGEYLLFIHFQACMMASPLNSVTIYGVSTTNEWTVREFIADKENNPTIYKGLPLHTEYRVFVDFDENKILGVNPYWDPKVMKQRFGHEGNINSPHQIHDYTIYQMHEETLMRRYEENKDAVCAHILKMLPDMNMSGQWSIDVMQNGDDFWVIDMALATNSALIDCVPKNLLKPTKENWLPELPTV